MQQQIHVLIIDESPDFAKSLGNLIIDVIGTENALVNYAFNVKDGIRMAGQNEFHFVFMGVYFTLGDNSKNKILFKNLSINSFTKIIAVSFHNELGFKSLMKEAGANYFLAKDEIEADKLAAIFEGIK